MKKIILISMVVGLSSMNLFAQSDEVKYRRSSLSMVLIESESFPNKAAVMDSWNSYPFPDKYNQHNVETKSFSIASVELTDEDLLEAGYLQDTLNKVLQIAKAAIGGPVRYLNDKKTLAFALPTEKKEFQIKLDKFIKKKGLAKDLVSTWFNRSADGKFDMSLIQERGFYNASEMEATIASGQAKGLASLGDAGEELIKKSFITFTKLSFVKNEPAARLIMEVAKAAIEAKDPPMNPTMKEMAFKALEVTYDLTKDGYSLWSKTWLYSLAWNDTISNAFYSQMWSNPEAFDNAEIFKLEFVGFQNNSSLVTFAANKSQEQILDLALVRNIDNAFAKLQKEYDVFKPAIPVSSSGPIMASIGLKEGIVAGDKFEVLEMMWDEEAGKTTWTTVGKCAVDKKTPIWDNRYNAGEETEPQKDEEGNLIGATTFKGSKKIQVGMLLKQLK